MPPIRVERLFAESSLSSGLWILSHSARWAVAIALDRGCTILMAVVVAAVAAAKRSG